MSFLKISKNGNKYLIATFIFILSFSLTVRLWQYYNEEDNKINYEKFKGNTLDIQTTIQDRLLLHEKVVQNSTGLIESMPDNVGQASWVNFIKHMNIKEYYPGLLTVGFAKHIDDMETNNYINKVNPDFKAQPEDANNSYIPIVYIYPDSENKENMVGVNLYKVSSWFKYFALAREHDAIQMSEKFKPVIMNDKESQEGNFIMVLNLIMLIEVCLKKYQLFPHQH